MLDDYADRYIGATRGEDMCLEEMLISKSRSILAALQAADHIPDAGKMVAAPAPHCQLCGGNVQGWFCQTCEAEFHEENGLLVLRSEAAPADPVSGVGEAVAWRKRTYVDAFTHGFWEPWVVQNGKPADHGGDYCQVEPLYTHPAPSPPVEKLVGALEEARDFIDHYSDMNDGDYGGQEPNAAMQIVHAIDEALAQAKGSGS